MRFLIFLFFSVCFVTVKSQVPGYIGKKNIMYAGGRASVIPAGAYLLDPEDNLTDYNKTAFAWNVGAKRVIGRSGMVGLSATYLQANVFGAKEASMISTLYSGMDVAVDLRSYFYSSKGSIAPLGKYFKYNFMYSWYALNTVQNKIPVGQVMFLGLGLGMGKSRVFYDKIWVDYGWDFNWLINIYDQQDMVKGWDYTKQVQHNLQNSYGIYFNLAVGYVY